MEQRALTVETTYLVKAEQKIPYRVSCCVLNNCRPRTCAAANMADTDVDFECLQRAKFKLDVIDQFYRRQVGKGDVEDWVLPACKVAFLTPGHEKRTIHNAIMKFAFELRDLPAQHAAGTKLLSDEGREALGHLLLTEAYVSSPREVRIHFSIFVTCLTACVRKQVGHW
jgi:hypothetical protein